MLFERKNPTNSVILRRKTAFYHTISWILWGVEDSNLRRLSQQIYRTYSPTHYVLLKPIMPQICINVNYYLQYKTHFDTLKLIEND